MTIRLFTLLAFLFVCSTGSAEDSVEVPLDEIWATKMPGTKDINELEKDQQPPDEATTDIRHKTLTSHIIYLLNAQNRPAYGRKAETGFVVVGTGYDALKEAQAVLSKKKQRRHTFPAGEDLTLVFFSYSCPRAVVIDKARREGNRVTVNNYFHAHDMRMSSANVALIPLGKLPPGKVQVNFERQPDKSNDGETPPMDDQRAMATICDSFSFGVGYD